MGGEKEDARGTDGCHVPEEDIPSPMWHSSQGARHRQKQEEMPDKEAAKNVFMYFQIIIFKTEC